MTGNVTVKNHPFVKKFSDGGFFYVYDVNTNQIIEVEKPVYDIIDEYDDDNHHRLDDKYREAYNQIEKVWKDHGLFSGFRPQKVTLGVKGTDGVKALHKKGFRQLVIEISKKCNLNCRYCFTSGKYSNPGTSGMHMSSENCKKAIDFFCERAVTSEQPFITLYGGEPLIRFDLIKEAVEYVKKKYGRKKYSFNLTTNGTLFNKENLDFFIRNDFYLMVSLDGPEIINDRYRLYKNGKGTFKRIMRNLEFIKRYNSDYYSNRVSISSVISPPYDHIDDILDFFSTDDTLKEIKGKIRSSVVETRGISFIEDFALEDSLKDFPNVFDTFNERLKKSIICGDLDFLTIEKKKVYMTLYNLARRPLKRLYEYVHPLGACHIGLRRLFVDTDGNFYICERVHNNYRIGCIDKGFDYERIVYYYRKFEDVLDDCRNCWAISHCERCWATIGDIEEFSGKVKEEFCSVNKKIIEKAFKLYTQLLSEDPDCLKVFKDVVIG